MKEYLPEDQDLLDELEKIGPMSTGIALAEQQRKINVIQIKSTLRHRKTTNDADKSARGYAFVVIVFTMVLFVVAISQLLFDVETSDHWIIGLSVLFLCAAFIVIIFKKFNPDKLNRE